MVFKKPHRNSDYDNVTKPKYYTIHPSGVECVDITRFLSFLLGNAWKYLWRYNDKGNPIQDLEKAIQYLEWERDQDRNMSNWWDANIEIEDITDHSTLNIGAAQNYLYGYICTGDKHLITTVIKYIEEELAYLREKNKAQNGDVSNVSLSHDINVTYEE